jgi:hypothetical protein
MRNRIAVAGWVMSLAVAGGGCTAISTVTTTSAATTTAPMDTTTIETTTTTLVPLRVGAVAGWEGRRVGSVCLRVTQSYPQVPGYQYDLGSVLNELLTPSGVTVLAADGDCDAVLDVQMSLEGRSAEYIGIGTIYSGMLRHFDMTLSATEHEALTFEHLTDTTPSQLASSTGPRTPEQFVDFYADVWAGVALQGLMQFWGPAVAIEAMRSETYRLDAYPLLCDLGEFAPGECPASEYGVWRAWFDGSQGAGAPDDVTDPLPSAGQPGAVTCTGCPQIGGITDFTPDVGKATTLTLAGTVIGADGSGTFFIDDGRGHSVGGLVPVDDGGAFEVTVPLFCGEQSVKLVWQNGAGTSGVVLHPLSGACTAAALQVTLTWDGQGDDFELHLIREGGRINDRTDDGSTSNDCTWNTCISSSPDWGVIGSSDDDPVKDIDDTGSFGPENIRLEQPEPITYTVMVEHWGSGSPDADGKVTINVEGGDVLTVPITDLAPHWVVTVATIEFPSGTITPIGKKYDCNDEWGFNGGCGAVVPS